VDKKSVEGQTPVQLCNYTDVYKNEYIDSVVKFMSATATAPQIAAFNLQRGDVLITKDSETPADIAVPALVTEDLFGVLCGYHLALVRPDPNLLEPRFLLRALETTHVNRQFETGATGVTRYGLRTDVIRDALIPLPGLETQRLIADFLDRETGRVDALVEAKRKLIDLLSEKRTALITHAVTKGLDPAVPMRPSGIEALGDVPEHWEVRSLKRVAGITYGLGQPPPTREAGVPIIRATNINRGRIDRRDLIYADVLDLPLERAPLLQAGEILVVRSGALTGDSAIVPPEFEGAAPGYDLRVTVLDAEPDYVALYLLSQAATAQIDLQSKRAAQPHLNAQELGDLRLAVPPIGEQEMIVRRVTTTVVAMDALDATIRSQLGLLAEYRQALITAAVTGQLDEATLKGQMPADEAMEFEVPV
jgi:type I restriction enzyme S subunit